MTRVHGKRERDEIPLMVWADRQGRVFEERGWQAAGRSGRETLPLEAADLIPLPEGSELFLMPGRAPVGFRGGRPAVFEPGGRRERTTAVAAFLPPAYTQYLLPAFRRRRGAPVLPLYAYTAVAFMDGRLWSPAVRVDRDPRQDPAGFDCGKIEEGIAALLASFPGNRLLVHLARCAREYFCPAARNLFLHRFEAPLPSSPSCNARCLGCISLQPSGCCPATQERITFIPEPEEIVEVACSHFERAPEGVASFGQGCEGEPLLVAPVLEQAVSGIRKATPRGTVNLNTNGSLPDWVPRLGEAGLDAVRVSLNSVRPNLYESYYRPAGYSFGDVRRFLGLASAAGIHVSLNYFVFPGVTDQQEEVDALADLIEETGIRMIQWRNLNIDPDRYLDVVPAPGGSLGVARAMEITRKRFPELRHGYFNPALEK